MEGRLRYLEQLETRQTIAARPNRAARLLESLPEGQVLHNIGHNPTHEDQLSFSKMSAYTLQKDEWLPSLIQGIESNSGAESKTQYAKRALPFADFVSRDSNIYQQRRIIIEKERLQMEYAASIANKRGTLADLETNPVADHVSVKEFDVKSWRKYENAPLQRPKVFIGKTSSLIRDEKSKFGLWANILTPMLGFRPSSSLKIRNLPDPAYIMHLVYLCVIDEREDAALLLLHKRLPSLQILKKSQLRRQVRLIFLRALEKGFDRLALLIVQSGFPENPLAAIFAHLRHPRRFPSYLLVAISYGRELVVSCMVKKIEHDTRKEVKSSPLNRGWFNGLSPLFVAQFCNNGHGSFTITKMLLKANASPSKAVITYSTYLRCKAFSSLLQPAPVTKLRPKILQRPPKKSVKLSRSSRKIFRHTRVSALDIACAVGKSESALRLVQELSSESLCVSEFSLLLEKDLEVVLEMLKKQPKLVQQRDPRGSTPLHYAARAGRADLIAVYLYFGLKVDAINYYHWTPLHEAAHRGHRATVQYLISRGASCAILNDEGHSALQLARKQGISSEEIYDFFHSADTIQRTRAIIGDLVDRHLREITATRNEGPQSPQTEPMPSGRGRKRFVVESLFRYPKQLFSWRRGSSSTSKLSLEEKKA